MREKIIIDETGWPGLVEELAGFFEPGRLVFLQGELGSGKTSFVRAVTEYLGVEDLVSSPSFAIINLYQGANFPIAHLDLYRLETAGQLADLGVDDYLSGDYLVFVEWPENAAEFFPLPDLRLEIKLIENARRREIRLEGKLDEALGG